MRKYGFLLLLLCVTLFTNAQIGAKMNASTSSSSLAGTWMNNSNGQTITLLLFDNGTGEFDGTEINYQTSNGKLIIKSNGASTSYTYKLTGNSLTLSGGDLAKAVVFTKSGAGNNNATSNMSTNTNSGNDLIGTWAAQNMQFTFMKNGKMMYNDKTMDYTVNGNQLHCSNAAAGVSVTYEYEVSQGHLMLRYNGNTMMLAKKNGNTPVNNNQSSNNNNSKSSLFGEWVSNEGENLVLMQGGRMTLNGYELSYSYDATTITVQAPAGSVVFSYKLTPNSLTVTTNGTTSFYQRKGTGGGTGATGNNNMGAVKGNIDPTMVGKWSRMGASGGGYNSSGSSQYSEYFILNADGTYEYHSETARSAYGTNQYGDETYRGSAGGDNNDKGTWSVKGNILIANSYTKGTAQYAFQKRNNKNNDPMIVIDGTEYVTFYKKPAW
ncbi:MAG TPA: hypothetical protein VHM26_09315 [Chitinophagaceae bacterium]|nr:hypothetical protein [Chitinophagaceae bacterium]